MKATRRSEACSWTEEELRRFLRAANGHRYSRCSGSRRCAATRSSASSGTTAGRALPAGGARRPGGGRLRLQPAAALAQPGSRRRPLRDTPDRGKTRNRPRPHDDLDPRRVASAATRRGCRDRCRARRMGFHRRRRPPCPSALDDAGFRADGQWKRSRPHRSRTPRDVGQFAHPGGYKDPASSEPSAARGAVAVIVTGEYPDRARRSRRGLPSSRGVRRIAPRRVPAVKPCFVGNSRP